MHKQGINEVKELNNFRTFVNVIRIFRTKITAIITIKKNLYSEKKKIINN